MNATSVASEIWARAGRHRLPVDLNAVVRLWPDLRVSLEDIDGPGYFVDLGSRGGEILIRKSDRPRRQRFTLAHELGHWVLSRTHQHKESASAMVEKWCDQFAANLLMPAEEVVQYLRKSRLPGLANAILAGPKIFDVSHIAFRLRVPEITPLQLFLSEGNDNCLRLVRGYNKTALIHEQAESIAQAAYQIWLGNDRDRRYVAKFGVGTVVGAPLRSSSSQGWLIGVLWRSDQQGGLASSRIDFS